MLTQRNMQAFALTLAIGLTACSQMGASHDQNDKALIPIDCPNPEPGAILFWMEPESLMPGQTRPVIPNVASMPGMMEPLPSHCLTDLEVIPEEAGTIEVNSLGDYEIRVSETAPVGEPVDVTGRYKGKLVRSRFTVFQREASPLVGYWRQSRESCEEETHIEELVFNADGTFSVTWTPFETYKDYWGTYNYNAETGQLDLEVETGNIIGLGISSGTIMLEDRVLTLGTASFGRRTEESSECRAAFN